MRQPGKSTVVIIAAALGAAAACSFAANDQDANGELEGWSSDFSAEKQDLSSTGKNPYFVLEPGYQLVLEDDDELLTISVLHDTKLVDGVETRVVEERETKKGKPVEVSRNFFAISKRTNSVYYFGEEVDDYKDGKIVGHPGAWLSGEKEARFGLMMPGLPLLKARFYNEVAPKVAMDRAEVVSTSATYKTPAGEFKNCLKIEETTPLEPKTKESKLYAPGIGLIQDGSLKLVKYGMANSTSAKSAAVAVAAGASTKEDDEDEDEKESKSAKPKEEQAAKIKFAEAPAAVLKTFQAKFPKAEVHKIEVEVEDGVTVYDIEFREGATEKETDITADGIMLEFTVVINAKALPAAAMKAVEKAADGAKLDRIEQIEISYETKDGKALKLPRPITRYAVEMTKGKKTAEVVVNPDGTVVESPKWESAKK